MLRAPKLLLAAAFRLRSGLRPNFSAETLRQDLSFSLSSASHSVDRHISPTVEANLRARDRVPDDYKLIYRAPLQRYIQVTYSVTFATILVLPVLFAAVYLNGNIHTYPMQLADITLFDNPNEALLMTLILGLTVLNVAHTVGKYPFRIYRHLVESKYVAVFQHPVPLLVKQRHFKGGDAKKMNSWFWNDSSYRMGTKRVLLIADHFQTPIELEKMTTSEHSQQEATKRRSRML